MRDSVIIIGAWFAPFGVAFGLMLLPHGC